MCANRVNEVLGIQYQSAVLPRVTRSKSIIHAAHEDDSGETCDYKTGF